MNQPTIYVGAHQRQLRDNFVYALEAATGSLLWHYPLHDVSPSSPVATPTAVYFSASNGSLYALHANDGTLLWQQQVHHQVLSPPVLANGLLYVTTPDAVLALQMTNGSLQWQHSVPGILPVKPVAARDRIHIRLRDGSVSTVDASSGSLLWRTPGRGNRLSSLVATPDVVYLAVLGEDLSALQASDGSPLWHQPIRYMSLHDPILNQGVLYLKANDRLQARLGSDGSLLWSQRARGGHQSLATISNLLLTCQATDSTAEVSALRISDGSLVWRWQRAFDQGGVTTPVAAYGAIYVGIGASGGLYALSVNDGNVRWHALDDMSISTAAVSEREAVEESLPSTYFSNQKMH
ncbi:MAG TPA: PQQ-binding-like beta-propeller repeat protein [Ktedonobacteraceae bacterium]|nr:PQQ-binding-like beta-propeller repeat protein [Ktedonobacteraceae bacterium]